MTSLFVSTVSEYTQKQKRLKLLNQLLRIALISVSMARENRKRAYSGHLLDMRRDVAENIREAENALRGSREKVRQRIREIREIRKFLYGEMNE